MGHTEAVRHALRESNTVVPQYLQGSVPGPPPHCGYQNLRMLKSLTENGVLFAV